MSLNQRRNIAQWIFLLAGISLIAMQVAKYWNGTLELKIEEAIVTLFAVTLALMPKLILANILGLLVGCWLCAIIGHLWETEQVKNFKAKYSKTDILLSIFGGLIIGVIQLLN